MIVFCINLVLFASCKSPLLLVFIGRVLVKNVVTTVLQFIMTVEILFKTNVTARLLKVEELALYGVKTRPENGPQDTNNFMYIFCCWLLEC